MNEIYHSYIHTRHIGQVLQDDWVLGWVDCVQFYWIQVKNQGQEFEFTPLIKMVSVIVKCGRFFKAAVDLSHVWDALVGSRNVIALICYSWC